MKKIALGVLLALSSYSVMAVEGQSQNNWVVGANYLNFSTEGSSIDLGAIVGSVGYKIKASDNFYLIPEFRYGVGVKDERIRGYKQELDNYLSLSLRGQFEFNNGVYVFLAPSYTRAKITGRDYRQSFRSGRFSRSVSPKDYSVDFGAGYHFNKAISAELMYKEFDNVDVFNLGVNYKF